VAALVFRNGASDVWRPATGYTMRVYNATPDVCPPEIVDGALATLTASEGGAVTWTRGTRDAYDVFVAVDGEDRNAYDADGRLFAAELAYVRQVGGVINGERVTISRPEYCTPKIVLHGLGHIAGLGHAEVPGDHVMGAAPMDQGHFSADELRAFSWRLSVEPGARREGEARAASVRGDGPIVCPIAAAR
jgi:hypothetical protein